jgi:protein gp37
MQETIISWTKLTWNPVAGCSKVTDGCKFCYAAALSQRYGWTTKPWTIQNEEENVRLKPHKLFEPYKVKEPSRIFVNSMSDQFHRVIPDWYRAAIFCIMLDLPQHTFQVLTKRPEATIDWPEKFLAAIRTPEFRAFAQDAPDKRVKAALQKAINGQWESPWAPHIWMGTSVEDARVLHRIDSLRQNKAHVRFISAEPLIGAWGNKVELSGIHWVIVGGESGDHLTSPDNPRWLKMEWAREIKNLCVDQGVAYFFKQDSGIRTELRPYLIETDGSKWKWEQYPFDHKPPILLDANNKPNGSDDFDPTGKSLSDCLVKAAEWERAAHNWWRKVQDALNTDNAALAAAYWYEQANKLRKPFQNVAVPPTPQPPTQVVSFRDVKEHWDSKTKTWDSPNYVYIGRANGTYGLPPSKWGNPFPLDKDTPELREQAIESYRAHLQRHPQLLGDLESLRGKILVCWCKDALHPDRACHGDVLLEMLGEKQPEAPQEQPQIEQLSLF